MSRRWPLTAQLALGFALVAILALGGGGALLLNRLQAQSMTGRADRALLQAQAAADLVAERRFLDTPESLPLALFTFQAQTGVRPVILDTAGKVVADSYIPSPLMGQALPHPEVAQALKGERAVGYRELEPGRWVLYAAVPRQVGQRPMGAVLVSADLSDLATSLTQMRRLLALILTGTGLAAVALGLWLARYLSRPLVRLHGAAAALAEGDLATRVEPEGSREVAELGHQFNQMAAQLDQLDEQRRSFVANASHELRTPVAAIRALAEALLATNPGDPYQEYLSDIVKESERARHLMDRLLELAKLEGRSEPARSERFDLRELCLDLVDSLEPVAQKRGVALQVEAAVAPVWLQGDPWLIEAVLSNLAENGLKYTPAGGRVTIRLVDALRIAVQDTGPGIAPDHLPRLFERFYRVDRSRARATGGVGLGLSIAAEAARLLGGRIEVASSPGEGSRFTLLLPKSMTTN